MHLYSMRQLNMTVTSAMSLELKVHTGRLPLYHHREVD